MVNMILLFALIHLLLSKRSDAEEIQLNNEFNTNIKESAHAQKSVNDFMGMVCKYEFSVKYTHHKIGRMNFTIPKKKIKKVCGRM